MSNFEIRGTDDPVNLGPVENDIHAVRAHLAIIREADSTFSVIVLNLKGCGSCGATEEEAIARVREAVAGVVESYVEDGSEVPWTDATDRDIPDGAKIKWIMVNV